MSYPVRDYTKVSRYALYDSGAFALQYGVAAGQYEGTYQQENGSITFRFAVGSRWQATGTLNGDRLEVRYNMNMELDDFENAVYLRVQ